VSTAATFVGYLLGGVPGAMVATIGIFLPGFVLVAATGPLLERWHGRPWARRTLAIVNAAVVGLIAAVVVRLAPAAVAGSFELAVAVAGGVAVWAAGTSTTAVLIAATALGMGRAALAQ
jgi:chromate transporter